MIWPRLRTQLTQLILRQAPFLYILQNFTFNLLHVRSLTWTEQLVASAPLAHWLVGNKMDKTEQRSHMQTEWHNKCTGWHGWSWQLPKQAGPGNVHQFTAFLLSISRSQGFSRDSNVKVTIIQRAFCFHCYLHLIMHSLSDCFLVLFCFQARGSQGGYAKTPWQASMATQKAWDFCRMHLNALNALNTDRRSRLKSIVKEVLRTVNRRSGRLCRLCVDYRRRNWVSLGVFELQAAKTWRELYETQGRPCPKPILGTELSLSPGSSRWYIVHNAKILKHLETLCNPRWVAL